VRSRSNGITERMPHPPRGLGRDRDRRRGENTRER
jgi:hypothetical protein